MVSLLVSVYVVGTRWNSKMYQQHMFDGLEILHYKLIFTNFSIIFIVLVNLAW